MSDVYYLSKSEYAAIVESLPVGKITDGAYYQHPSGLFFKAEGGQLILVTHTKSYMMIAENDEWIVRRLEIND